MQPTNTVAGVTITPSVTVRIEDTFGNLTTSTATVAVALTTPGSATLSGTASTTASGGVATFSTLSVNKTGTYTLTATSSGLAGDTSNLFDIMVGAASKLTFSQHPTNAVAGVTITPSVTVRVEDAVGNLITTSSATVAVALTTPNGATLTGTSATASGGIATFSNLSVNKTGTYTLTATSAGLASDTSNSFTIAHAATASLTFSTQPSGSTGGVAFTTQPIVTLRDTFGNLVTTPASVTLSVTTNPAVGFSCTNATVSSNSSGLASFAGCKINTAGSYTLTATAGAITAPSNSITIAVGPVATLAFSAQPSAITVAGVNFAQQPSVTATDSGSNLVSGASVVLSVTGNPSVGFSCTSTTASTSASGIATFAGCKITKSGPYTLTATVGSVTVASSPLTITPAAAVAPTFSTPPSGTATAGIAFAAQPVVTVVDAFGNARTGDSVVLSVTGNPAIGFSCPTTTLTVSTDANGNATFVGCVITKAGTYTLVGTANALAVTSSQVIVSAAPAATATFSTQPSATTVANVPFAQQPSVTVVDAFGNPRSGDSVVLSVTGNPTVGFSCTSTTATANASGIATFAGCKITKSGPYTLTATVGSVTTVPPSSTLTITGAAGSKMVLSNCLINNGAVACTSPFAVNNSGNFKANIDVLDAFDNVPTAAPFVINLSSDNALFTLSTQPVNVTGSGSPTNRSTQFTVTFTSTGNASANITATSTGLTNLVFIVKK